MSIPESNLECPITYERMQDPVMDCNGHTYERAAIEEWLEKKNGISPITNLPLEDKTLKTNYTVKNIVAALSKNNQDPYLEVIPVIKALDALPAIKTGRAAECGGAGFKVYRPEKKGKDFVPLEICQEYSSGEKNVSITLAATSLADHFGMGVTVLAKCEVGKIGPEEVTEAKNALHKLYSNLDNSDRIYFTITGFQDLPEHINILSAVLDGKDYLHTLVFDFIADGNNVSEIILILRILRKTFNEYSKFSLESLRFFLDGKRLKEELNICGTKKNEFLKELRQFNSIALNRRKTPVSFLMWDGVDQRLLSDEMLPVVNHYPNPDNPNCFCPIPIQNLSIEAKEDTEVNVCCNAILEVLKSRAFKDDMAEKIFFFDTLSEEEQQSVISGFPNFIRQYPELENVLENLNVLIQGNIEAQHPYRKILIKAYLLGLTGGGILASASYYVLSFLYPPAGIVLGLAFFLGSVKKGVPWYSNKEMQRSKKTLKEALEKKYAPDKIRALQNAPQSLVQRLDPSYTVSLQTLKLSGVLSSANLLSLTKSLLNKEIDVRFLDLRNNNIIEDQESLIFESNFFLVPEEPADILITKNNLYLYIDGNTLHYKVNLKDQTERHEISVDQGFGGSVDRQCFEDLKRLIGPECVTIKNENIKKQLLKITSKRGHAISSDFNPHDSRDLDKFCQEISKQLKQQNVLQVLAIAAMRITPGHRGAAAFLDLSDNPNLNATTFLKHIKNFPGSILDDRADPDKSALVVPSLGLSNTGLTTRGILLLFDLARSQGMKRIEVARQALWKEDIDYDDLKTKVSESTKLQYLDIEETILNEQENPGLVRALLEGLAALQSLTVLKLAKNVLEVLRSRGLIFKILKNNKGLHNLAIPEECQAELEADGVIPRLLSFNTRLALDHINEIQTNRNKFCAHEYTVLKEAISHSKPKLGLK